MRDRISTLLSGIGRPYSVPALKYLMVSGAGRPDEESFRSAAQSLFPVAYVSKFLLKAAMPEEDFTVMPMEVKWKLDRSQHGSKRYYWTMMIMQPACMDVARIEKAVDTLRQKKKSLPYEGRLRLRTFEEKTCGQIFHIVPYEGPMERSFDLQKKELCDQAYDWEPDSHDIYFNDIRMVEPEKLTTIVRVRIWKKGESMPELDDPFVQW